MLWLLWYSGGSTADSLSVDEQRIVVVLFVVVFGVVLVLVVSLRRTCYLVVCCWLGCRSRDDTGRMRGQAWNVSNVCTDDMCAHMDTRAMGDGAERHVPA